MKLNRKNKLLIVGMAIGLYISYAYAIANTVGYYRQYSSNTEILENNLNSPALLEQLVSREKQLNSILDEYSTVGTASFQNELLKRLTVLARNNNLKIIDFQEPHYIIENEVKTASYVFGLEGSFNGILLLINNIENNPSLGFVKHIEFIKKKNYKTDAYYLTAELILQKNQAFKSR